MTGDRERGLSAFSTWYQATSLAAQGVPYEKVVALYDTKHPSFMVAFGGATRDALSVISEDRMSSAIRGLASQSERQTADLAETGFVGYAYPHTDSFFEALTGELGTFRWEDFKDAVAATSAQIESAADSSVKNYLKPVYWALAGAAVLVVLSYARLPRPRGR
jgi:hypothetical protein